GASCAPPAAPRSRREGREGAGQGPLRPLRRGARAQGPRGGPRHLPGRPRRPPPSALPPVGAPPGPARRVRTRRPGQRPGPPRRPRSQWEPEARQDGVRGQWGSGRGRGGGAGRGPWRRRSRRHFLPDPGRPPPDGPARRPPRGGRRSPGLGRLQGERATASGSARGARSGARGCGARGHGRSGAPGARPPVRAVGSPARAAARRSPGRLDVAGRRAVRGPREAGLRRPALSGRQQELCRRKPHLLPSIGEGARLGIQECRSQFRHERWNCLLAAAAAAPAPVPAPGAGPLFGYELSSGTKETAFIYAVMAAGLVHSVTRSCSAGNMTECSCDTTLQNGGSASEGWHWGGCSDDVQYGMWFSRKFLDFPIRNTTGKESKVLLAMNLHNNEAGRQAVAKLMSVDCRCHGVSGSCAVKTCWKTMSSFEKIGRLLKDKYENSIQISDKMQRKMRRRDKDQRRIPIRKDDLLYVNKSPNYCVEDKKLGIPGTRGRECNRTSQGAGGCNLLCCGRGYNTHVVRHVERCECKFIWCCYVRCRRCESMTDVHTYAETVLLVRTEDEGLTEVVDAYFLFHAFQKKGD
uniref:Protein Wnt n=1 Tax=Canis lupus familiaris TaxID=9615 RepID=A0A8C0QCA7_CANLF